MTGVSVIIPAFNAEATIAKAIRSVVAQTHRKLDIFVVDDGSTDNTAMIARGFVESDRRVRLLRQKNAGVAAARNAALAVATTPFSSWLDADDIWHPTKIEKQLDTYMSAPSAPSFVYSGYRLIDRSDAVLPNFRPLTDVSGYTFCRQMATNFFSNVSSLFAPTELARRFGGHDPALRGLGLEGAEDFLLQLRLSAVGPVACCREALVGYRMHDRNMSRGHDRAARSNIRAIEMATAAAPGVPDWVVRMGRSRTVGYALHMLGEGKIAEAGGLVAHLMRGQPGYTLTTLMQIALWQARAAMGSAVLKDPEVGKDFFVADPGSAPWQGYMLLNEGQLRALKRADAAFFEGTVAPLRRVA